MESGSESTDVRLEKMQGQIDRLRIECQRDALKTLGWILGSLALLGSLAVGSGAIREITGLARSIAEDGIRAKYQASAKVEVARINQLFVTMKDMLDRRTGQRLTCGQVNLKECDVRDNSVGGVVVRVDTKQAGLTAEPFYVVTLSGSETLYRVVGAGNIYSASKDGFALHLMSSNPFEPVTLEEAKRGDWTINWIAVVPESVVR